MRFAPGIPGGDKYMPSLCGLPFPMEYSARADRSIIPRREEIAIPLFFPRAAKKREQPMVGCSRERGIGLLFAAALPELVGGGLPVSGVGLALVAQVVGSLRGLEVC